MIWKSTGTPIERTPLEGGLSPGEAAKSDPSSQVARLFPTMRVLMQRQRHAPMESKAFNAPLQDAIDSLQAFSARLMVIAQLTAQVSNDAAQAPRNTSGNILCEHKRPPWSSSSGRPAWKFLARGLRMEWHFDTNGASGATLTVSGGSAGARWRRRLQLHVPGLSEA